ncbi:MAG TPA: molybdopterin-dependent oxidoreductase [Nitrolancea sp.]|nr:molybdopterin-dependent oxidoreductase [Nitrolancea sp.]
MRRSSLPGSGLLVGGIDALLATVVMLFLANLWGTPVLPQLLADRLIALVPVDLFGSVLDSLESRAKPLTLVGLTLILVLIGGLVGGLLAAAARRDGRPSRLFVPITAVTWGFLAFIAAPLGGIGLIGRDSIAGAWPTGIAFLVTAVVYAGAMVLGLRFLLERPSAGSDTSRRRFIKLAGFGLPTLLALVYLGRFTLRLSRRSEAATGAASAETALTSALTPVDDFYVVSKNFVDPAVSLTNWQLQVHGMVQNPRTYQYEEIKARPSLKKITTLECISNQVGGSYISTGEWTGFPLRDLLADAGVLSGVAKVVLRASDDYSDSIPLDAALDPDTILVYELGGQPLTKEHGFPLRLIVPGIYGMKNVKWITSIELMDTNYRGYWQQRGWSDIATVQTMSRIDSPRSNNRVPMGAETLVGGVAFSGDRGISRVDVSPDGGKTWSAASLEPPLSPLTWVRWTYHWSPAGTGRRDLLVRAWDGQGTPQSTEERPPLPDGATGLHRVTVSVVPASAGL